MNFVRPFLCYLNFNSSYLINKRVIFQIVKSRRYSNCLFCGNVENATIFKPIYVQSFRKRLKFRKSSKNEESDDSDSDDDGNSNLTVGNVTSLRTDAILKAGLGMSRNKLERMFYESRIRVNGMKIVKKGQKVNIDDEIDIIHGVLLENDDYLKISRVVVKSFKPNEDEDKIIVKMERFKDITIDNYKEHPWKSAN